MRKRSFVRWLYDCLKEDITDWVKDRRENWEDEKIVLSFIIALLGGFSCLSLGLTLGLFYGGFCWLILLVGVVSVLQFLYVTYKEDEVDE